MLHLLDCGVNRHGLPPSQEARPCAVLVRGPSALMFVLGSRGRGRSRAGCMDDQAGHHGARGAGACFIVLPRQRYRLEAGGVTLNTVAHLLVKFLVMPNRDGRLFLTDAGRAALRDLLSGL